MDVLRAQIARIEADGTSVVAFDRERTPRPVMLGRDLRSPLRSGLHRGSLTEVVAAESGDAGAASGFALALAIRFAASTPAPIVWVIEEGARRESGAPYAPGLAAHGLDPARLIVVRTARAADTLWATEEALKCRAVAAVVTDLWQTRAYDLVTSRRLVLAAGHSGTPCVLVPGAAGTAAMISSAAQTRFEIKATPSRRSPSADHRLPLPGPAALAVRVARIRAGPTGIAPYDWETFWPLAWDHEAAWFCDALPLPPPALPRDRPHPATAYGRHAA